MTTLRVLLLAVLACVVLPSASAGAATTCTSARPGPSLHTITAVCGGDRTTVRRPSDRIVVAATARGRWLAWVETRNRGGVATASVLRARRSAPSRARAVWASAFDTPDRVLVSSRGEVAFTTSKGLRLALAGGRARLVARDDGSSVVLDDDRTLRWLSERDGTMRFIDLPRPGLDGCAPRSGFVAAVRTPDIAVTVGDFLGTKADEPGAVVTRACLLASATDPVIAQGVRTTGRDEDLRPVGADRTWVVFARFDGLTSKIALETLDARDRRTGRRGAVPAELLPVVAREGVAATPVAVTEQGAPAWLVRRPDGDRLLALGASGALDELDRGPAGSIADLRAEGALVKWSGPGGPREAAP